MRKADPFLAGANAEYRCLPEKTKKPTDGLIAKMPWTMGYAEAAGLALGGMTALAFLRHARVAAGERVLVYGASGSMGTFAVQIAKIVGARVTAVCSTKNLELVESLGAEKVIDYTAEDLPAAGERYDIIFDAVGKLTSARAKRALGSGGRFLSVHGSARIEPGDLEELKVTAETHDLRTVIDRTYSLDQIVEAHRYVEAGHKRGNVVRA